MAVDLEVGTGRTGGRDATTGVIPGKYVLSVGCPDIEPPRGWKWTALSSVAQLESGHTPSRKHPEYWDGGIPWIGIKDATENHGRTIHDTHQHVSELGLQNSSARLLPANTVCLSRTASIGFVVVMGRPMATSQDFVNWVCGPKIDPHFLKYVLLLENEALWRFARGTTHQTIYYPEAKAFHVCLPPLPEQKAIARILGTLDDKIELNRRMNATLEAMARALFQSWFVDFDPVRRNMEAQSCPTGKQAAPTSIPEATGRWFTYAIQCQGGSVYIGQTDDLRRRWAQHVDGKGAEWTKTHPPVALVFWEIHDSLEKAVAREKWLKSGSGREWLKQELAARSSVHLPAGEAGAKAAGRQPSGMDVATASLFPASFQDSALGDIPAGWEVCPLSEKIEILSGGTPKTTEPTYWDGDIPWYSVKDAPTDSDIWVIQTEKRITQLGVDNSAAKIFPENTTIISARGTVGKLALTGMRMAMNQSCYGIRGAKGYGEYFTHFGLRQAVAGLQQRTHGTVFDTITRQTFDTLDCVFPPSALTTAFDKTVAPILVRIRANLHQSRTLITLRDTLLPKLLSGELQSTVTP